MRAALEPFVATEITDDATTDTATTQDNTDIGKAMTTHLTEDELVLHYYGEMTAGEETRAATHLTSCAECHENLRRLQRVLAVVDESALAGPELPDALRAHRLGAARTGSARARARLGIVARLLAGAASPGPRPSSLLVAAAFMAGRLLPPAPKPARRRAAPAQLRERILLVDLGDISIGRRWCWWSS